LVEFIFSTDAPHHEIAHQAAKASGKKSAAQKRHLTARERFAGQSMKAAWIATVVILAAVAWCWYFFLPLTYGYPGLSVPEVIRRKWLGYDLHFAK
jgi:dolichyl-phosphate-mannose-protein mannosyltransferase